jgi:porphobilinogen synthase
MSENGLLRRGRRLRGSAGIRGMVRETRLSRESLIFPVFVKEGVNIKEEIPSMRGQYRYSVDRLDECFDRLLASGVTRVLLFGLPAEKDGEGSGAFRDDGIVQKALRRTKERYPDLYLVTDICMCEYTSHGHCGVLDGHDHVDNDRTLEYLSRIALSHARAGADMVAPSDMMDHRVGAIRRSLDAEGWSALPIMAYSAKYSSAFYGPFREAADSAPAFGDRKGYQMDFHNGAEALKECFQDIEEGADIEMVKPALSYLDIIRRVADAVVLPVAAYSVSGEYSLIKAASAAGFVDEAAMICETAVAIRRAGADILITYFAPEIAGFITEGRIG